MRLQYFRGNVFVANIPPDFTDDQLAEAFDQFGMVLSAFVARDPATGKRLRYGFVDIATERAAKLAVARAELVLRKGFRSGIDSYSAFRENDRRTLTGLAAYLRERGFERLTVCGLATDFCVLFSALDAREAGFEVELAANACRGIDHDGSLVRAMRAMSEAGVTLRN